MSNSPLVDYTKTSPNYSSRGGHKIDTITIHCVVGQCTVETLGSIFAAPSRKASCNYGVGKDGKILLCVDESRRSWCSSSKANDQRAVTIECASDTTHPYAVTPAAYAALINLVTDICKRNGCRHLIWFGDKEKTLSYAPAPGEMIMTVHRWFANKSCPGDWLYSRHGAIAAEVNQRLSGETQEDNEKMEDEKHYDHMLAAMRHASTLPEPVWSRTDGYWQKAVDMGIINGDAPERPMTRVEFITVLGRLGLLKNE